MLESSDVRIAAQRNARNFARNELFHRLMQNYLMNVLLQRDKGSILRITTGQGINDTPTINVFAVRSEQQEQGTLVLQFELVSRTAVYIPFHRDDAPANVSGTTFSSFMDCLSFMRHLINSSREIPFNFSEDLAVYHIWSIDQSEDIHIFPEK